MVYIVHSLVTSRERREVVYIVHSLVPSLVMRECTFLSSRERYSVHNCTDGRVGWREEEAVGGHGRASSAVQQSARYWAIYETRQPQQRTFSLHTYIMSNVHAITSHSRPCILLPLNARRPQPSVCNTCKHTRLFLPLADR